MGSREGVAVGMVVVPGQEGWHWGQTGSSLPAWLASGSRREGGVTKVLELGYRRGVGSRTHIVFGFCHNHPRHRRGN